LEKKGGFPSLKGKNKTDDGVIVSVSISEKAKAEKKKKKKKKNYGQLIYAQQGGVGGGVTKNDY